MTYEYGCTVCHHVFRRRRTLAQFETSTPCPKCDGLARLRVFLTTFRLRGRGWAKDGYETRPSSPGSR